MSNVTADGILSEEWEIVASISASIANNVVGSNNEKIGDALVKTLFCYLDFLELKYGKIASLLATRADYVDDVLKKESLLCRAYIDAEDKNDFRNKTFISSSLSELYVDEIADFNSGKRWLQIFEENLNSYYDEDEESLLCELKERFNQKG